VGSARQPAALHPAGRVLVEAGALVVVVVVVVVVVAAAFDVVVTVWAP